MTAANTQHNQNAATTGLQKYLQRHGIAVHALAKDVGLEQSHLSRIVKREREPGVTAFAKLAHGLGMPMEDLFRLMYN